MSRLSDQMANLHNGEVVAIQEITLTDGTHLTIPTNGVTVVVGPNNSGKSTFLRHLASYLGSNPGQFAANLGIIEPGYRLIENVNLDASDNINEVIRWLRERGMSLHTSVGERFISVDGKSSIDVDSLSRLWGDVRQHQMLASLFSYFVYTASTEVRLRVISGVSARPSAGDVASHPFHYIEDNVDLLAKLNDVMEKTFQDALVLDNTGTQLILRVGKLGVRAPRLDESRAEYRKAMAKLPQLIEQGDGMKSFLGLLVPLVTASYKIVIVDEPDAFLHPPQALALGRLLARFSREQEIQIVLATHNRHLLAGLVSLDGAKISIVRLDRRDDITYARQIDPQQVSRLYHDPVLRYSNVLDCLMHRITIVAEAHGDCHFYSAALDYAHALGNLALPASDMFFIPSHGVGAMPDLVTRIRTIGASVACFPDFDVLLDPGTLRSLVIAMGGQWERLESDVTRIVHPFNRGEKSKAELKKYGIRALRREARQCAENVTAYLDSIGVFLVVAGELESFAPQTEAGKGSAWLREAIQLNAHCSDEAQSQVRRLNEYIGRVEPKLNQAGDEIGRSGFRA